MQNRENVIFNRTLPWFKNRAKFKTNGSNIILGSQFLARRLISIQWIINSLVRVAVPNSFETEGLRLAKILAKFQNNRHILKTGTYWLCYYNTRLTAAKLLFRPFLISKTKTPQSRLNQSKTIREQSNAASFRTIFTFLTQTHAKTEWPKITEHVLAKIQRSTERESTLMAAR